MFGKDMEDVDVEMFVLVELDDYYCLFCLFSS